MPAGAPTTCCCWRRGRVCGGGHVEAALVHAVAASPLLWTCARASCPCPVPPPPRTTQGIAEQLKIKPEVVAFNVTNWAKEELGYFLFKANSDFGNYFLVPPPRKDEAAGFGLELVP